MALAGKSQIMHCLLYATESVLRFCDVLQAQSGFPGAFGKQMKKPETLIDWCAGLAQAALKGQQQIERAKACQKQREAMQSVTALRLQQAAAARQAAQQQVGKYTQGLNKPGSTGAQQG